MTIYKLSIFKDMKSLWNCGSMTCIMCFTCMVSHLSINSSRANSLSGPHLNDCRSYSFIFSSVFLFLCTLKYSCFPFSEGFQNGLSFSFPVYF
uniref:Uncharacterized protein n=1 Tax=Scophthalmus maximus TaxID=52904 RepID=A0A8D3B050_SCOMX